MALGSIAAEVGGIFLAAFQMEWASVPGALDTANDIGPLLTLAVSSHLAAMLQSFSAHGPRQQVQPACCLYHGFGRNAQICEDVKRERNIYIYIYIYKTR